MHVHLLTRPDGSVIVVGLAPKARRDGEADATFAARVLARTLEANPKWKDYPVMTVPRADVAPMLSNRRFRNAWTLQAGTLTHDMAKVRGIRMEEIRVERYRRLTASDIRLLRARDQGDIVLEQKLITYRQALGDVPGQATADLAQSQTADAIEAYPPPWPVEP